MISKILLLNLFLFTISVFQSNLVYSVEERIQIDEVTEDYTIITLAQGLGGSNVYLIRNNRQYNQSILVDTSLTTQSQKVQKGIEDSGLRLTDITLIIITHTHYDHCQGLFELKKKLTNAQVLVHSNEEEKLRNGPLDRPSGFLAKLFNSVKGVLDYSPVEADIKMDFTKYPLDKYFPGKDYYILLTPGHSNGSLSVILDREAIVGDLMGNSPLTNENIDDIYDNWAVLLNLGLVRFYPGHGDGSIESKTIREELEAKRLVGEGGACMV